MRALSVSLFLCAAALGADCLCGVVDGSGESCRQDADCTDGERCARDLGGEGMCVGSEGEGEGEGEGEEARCGDGILHDGEACDDGDDDARDGCDACTVSVGFFCVGEPSVCRPTICGDGVVSGAEVCDDDNVTDDDGCSGCAIDSGFVCAGTPSACRRTVCGDGVVEGDERCDDQNGVVGDGCAGCQREPDCEGGTCAPICGDAAVFAGEACDDGNASDGDGCSRNCVLEEGFVCQLIEQAPPAQLILPITYRDFRGRDLDQGHCDFQRHAAAPAWCDGASGAGSDVGIVASSWDPVSRKPVYARSTGRSPTTTSAADFDAWYREVPAVNRTMGDTISLDRQANGTYVFENRRFFPINSRGFVAEGLEALRADDQGTPQNFHFTSELRFWFSWSGESITLTFFGDDDVFVFINGVLAVDIGGVHGPIERSVTITPGNQAQFGLAPGGVYEAAVFQAERQTVGSQYKLTLAGFFPPRTSCTPICGDGLRAGNEACDEGTANNTGVYGGCNADCTRASFCGDGIVDDNEVCDDGRRNGRPDFCDTRCTGQSAVCGNGVLDPTESCDQGAAGNTGAYGGCNADCTSAPFCGDGIVDDDREECDIGSSNGEDGCTRACRVDVGG